MAAVTTVELYLQHGRKTPDEDLDDWGPDGPRLKNVVGLHQTYGDKVNVYFTDPIARLEAQTLTGWEEWDNTSLTMKWEGDLIVVQPMDGPIMFYGDWGLIASIAS